MDTCLCRHFQDEFEAGYSFLARRIHLVSFPDVYRYDTNPGYLISALQFTRVYSMDKRRLEQRCNKTVSYNAQV